MNTRPDVGKSLGQGRWGVALTLTAVTLLLSVLILPNMTLFASGFACIMTPLSAHSRSKSLTSAHTIRLQLPIRVTTTDSTTRASVASNGIEGDSGSYAPCMSNGGYYVVLESDATNLVSGDSNGIKDVFIHDWQTGQTERVSVASDATQANAGSYGSSAPSASGDGRYLAFESDATNLVVFSLTD